MASASKTPNLNLPQWVGTEKPERTDFNGAFGVIDTTVASHLAESVSQVGGAHGLTIESGTWTPRLRGSGTYGTDVYESRNGSYYKIGNQVFIQGFMRIASLTGAAGYWQVSGLPFNGLNGIRYYLNVPNTVAGGVVADVSSDIIYLRGSTGTTAVAVSDITATQYVYITGSYLTA